MALNHEMIGDGVLVDAILRNGVDRSAFRRAHLRELTLARQAAERRNAQPKAQVGLERWEQQAATRERAAAFRGELARINAAHRTWLREQGVVVTRHSKYGRQTLEPGPRWPGHHPS